MIIYKYPLELTDCQVLELPCDRQVLKFAPQNGRLYVWVWLKAGHEIHEGIFENLLVRIVGTGNPINGLDMDGYVYQDTVFMDGFVWHIFAHRKSL